MTTSILSRISRDSLSPSPEYTALQSQVDGLVGGFVHQATDWKALAAMTAGGMAFRTARVGTLSRGLGPVNAAAARGISTLAGLGAEVSAYEVTHRGLSTVFCRGGSAWPPAIVSEYGRPRRAAPTDNFEQNLWKWSGPGGLRQGLLQSLITFGSLRGAGHLARGENIFVQHLLQDSAMVFGHNASASLGVTARPVGSLAEQFLHAEATNLQIGAGMALAHRFAPGLQALERGLDLMTPSPLSLSLEGEGGRRSGEGGLIRRFQLAFATALPTGRGAPRERPLTPGTFEILLSENTGEGAMPWVPTRKEYWFPHKALRGGPLHVKYTPASRLLADRLMEELSRTDASSSRPSELHLSLHWVHQLVDLAAKLNANVDIFGPERLTHPLVSGKEGGNSQILTQALELLRKDQAGPESEWVVEMNIPYENVSFGKEGTSYRTNLRYILKTIESHLYDSVRLVEEVPSAQALKVRFPTPALFERLLQVVAGDEATRFRYVLGEIPQGDLVKLKAQGEAPIGLSRDPVRLGDLGIKVHPALFTLHDLFHAISLSVFSQSFRRYAGWLYDLVINSRLRRSPLTREHLERLSDMDPPIVERRTYDSFFSYLFAHLASHYKKDFSSDEIRGRELLKYRFFLQDYLQLLDKNVPEDPEWRAWNEQIKSQLKPVVKGLDQILQKIAVIYFGLPK